ncbi:hypothetical protein DFH27DRAFT_542490 [Peziza echinospora]|nr:hypothetical protein DFH27DRAFT_542490 [Peziza echinospora]
MSSSSRAPPPRPKRPFAPSKPAPTAKRPRFDPRNPSTLIDTTADTPDALDDAILDLDEIGGGVGRKRGAVKIEGYDSDSSNEGYEREVVKEKNSGRKPKKSDADSDEDMFGGEDDVDEAGVDSDAGVGKKSKREVRFLDLDDIEGQESDNEEDHVTLGDSLGKGKGKGKMDDDSEDSEEEKAPVAPMDPELGAAHSHANPQLSAFNMRSEMDEGRFDSAGNFIRNAADADAMHDSWLDASNTSKRQMRLAREAAEKRAEEAKARRLQEDSIITSEVLSSLISELETGETILEALARLGKCMVRKKKLPKKKNTHKQSESTENHMEEDKDEENNRKLKATIEKITEAADAMLGRGQLEIYEATREFLLRLYKRETGDEYVESGRKSPTTSQAITDQQDAAQAHSSEPTKWEYRWTDTQREDHGTVYGPFGGQEMAAWNTHGFFEGGGIEFRKAADAQASAGKWTVVADF